MFFKNKKGKEMANRDTPNMGFIPVGRLDGSEIPVRRFSVTTASGTAMYLGDLVVAAGDGYATPHATAGAGDDMLGAVVGIYDSNGVPCGHPNASVSTKYLAASTAGYVDVALALPDSVFRAQCTGTLASTDVFAGVDHVAGTGNTTTSRSGHEVSASATTGANFKIIGKVEDPGNDWGANVELLLVPQESYWFDATDGV